MKNVLFVAYFFPPLGWSGAQRPLKFVKYLKDFGWNPIVVTVGKTHFSIRDETLLNEIPEDVRIIRIDDVSMKKVTDRMKTELLNLTGDELQLIDQQLRVSYLEGLEEKFEEIRNMILFPDGFTMWTDHVLQVIEKKIDLSEIDLVFTTVNPYSTARIGYELKRKFQIPWVLDIRDEWTNNPYIEIQDQLRYDCERILEETYVTAADALTIVTPVSRQNYIDHFPLHADKIHTITNGYDESDFTNLIFKQKKNERFTIVHNGTFYLARRPDPLLRAVEELIDERKIMRDEIVLRFIGKNEEMFVKEISTCAAAELIEWVGYIDHRSSLQLVVNSDLLLLVTGSNEQSSSVYTGKIFEYMRSTRPILALTPENSIAHGLLKNADENTICMFNDVKSIKDCVLKHYHLWSESKRPVRNEQAVIKHFERRKLTEDLSRIFNSMI